MPDPDFNANKPVEELTPESLQQIISRISTLRTDLLLSDNNLAPIGEQFYILALDSLSTALAHLKLTKYYMMRGE